MSDWNKKRKMTSKEHEEAIASASMLGGCGVILMLLVVPPIMVMTMKACGTLNVAQGHASSDGKEACPMLKARGLTDD